MRRLISLAMLMGAAFYADAHQLKSAVTTVLFNQHSGHIELMHRYYLHDTEHAIGQLFGRHADIIANKDDQAKFADYVKSNVAIKINSRAIPLSDVGFEIDGQFLWVYQETPFINDVKTIEMQNSVLRDIWPEQMNLVNVEGLGKVRSMHFDGQDDWLSIEFTGVKQN